MFLVGLTGGIASGKSTVAKRLVELGAVEIDADVIAREVVSLGSRGLSAVINLFGDAILHPDGSLNRAKLADIVFSDADSRRKLEDILHPLIRSRTQELLSQQQANAVVLYTVPLLVEANVDLPFDYIVTCEAGVDVQLERLQNSRGMTLAEAQARLGAQTGAKQRLERANRVIRTDSSIESLYEQVDELWEELSLMAKNKDS